MVGINFGLVEPTAINLGSTPVKEVYVGANKVWPTVIDPTTLFSLDQQGFMFDEQDASTLWQEIARTNQSVLDGGAGGTGQVFLIDDMSGSINARADLRCVQANAPYYVTHNSVKCLKWDNTRGPWVPAVNDIVMQPPFSFAYGFWTDNVATSYMLGAQNLGQTNWYVRQDFAQASEIHQLISRRGTLSTVNTPISVGVDAWHTFIGLYDGANSEIFIDGLSVATGTLEAPNNMTEWVIGAYTPAGAGASNMYTSRIILRDGAIFDAGEVALAHSWIDQAINP